MRRGITNLKMHGAWHEKTIREFFIDNEGMHVKARFPCISSIPSGPLSAGLVDEGDRLGSLLPDCPNAG